MRTNLVALTRSCESFTVCEIFSFPSLNFVSTGVDAARAFGTGCFKTHRTHDTRGMSESELQVKSCFCLAFPDSYRPLLQSLAHWKNFYAEHEGYVRVGRVSHPPIDPASPIPEHCDPNKEAAAKAKPVTQIQGKTEVEHEEL